VNTSIFFAGDGEGPVAPVLDPAFISLHLDHIAVHIGKIMGQWC